MNLPKKVGLTLSGILVVPILGISNAPELRAQSDSILKFEVASVRPSPPLQLPLRTGFRAGVFLDGNHVEIRYMSLRSLITLAYQIKPYQLPGTPEWMTTEVFDILATFPQGVAPEMSCGDYRPCNVAATKVPEMLQSLLAERFGLKVRRESKEMPAYVLTVAKGGPKLKEAPPEDPQAALESLRPSEGEIAAGVGGAPARIGAVDSRGAASALFDGRGNPAVELLHVEIPRTTLGQLADGLTSMLDLPVLDRTGLTGTYEIGLNAPSRNVRWTFQGPMPGKPPIPGPPAEDAEGGSLLESVRPLGLHLEKDKAAIDIIVIEHIERTPTEN